jgi:hypothetical protein
VGLLILEVSEGGLNDFIDVRGKRAQGTPEFKCYTISARALAVASSVHQDGCREISTSRMRATHHAATQLWGGEADAAVDALVYLILGLVGDGIEEQRVHYGNLLLRFSEDGIVVDMMHEDGRVFLKSEWGQIGNDWPCVSFTKSSVGEFLRANFRPKRDILIYVGTTNAEMTENHDHRSRLISTVSIEPNQLISTKKMIPADVWARSTAKWGDRWPHAMAVLNAANFFGPPFPYAREVIPSAYASLGQLTHPGGVADVFSLERKALMGLAVQ